jgi:hypothetical protein
LPDTTFLSFDGAVVGLSAVSGLSALALSAEETFRAGGFGFELGAVDNTTSCFGLEFPDDTGCELILFSDLIASFVENIRVRRFVIEGFSVGRGANFCGSDCGAVLPLRLSVLGIAMPFCTIAGWDSGDPMADEVADVEGDGRGLSERDMSRCAATVAMMF